MAVKTKLSNKNQSRQNITFLQFSEFQKRILSQKILDGLEQVRTSPKTLDSENLET